MIAGVRPASVSKPEVDALKAKGVEVRVLDLENWSVDQIADALNGIDVVICTTNFFHLDLQKPLLDAAKKVGVKRFVPDDFASACVPGVRKLHDIVRLSSRDDLS